MQSKVSIRVAFAAAILTMSLSGAATVRDRDIDPSAGIGPIDRIVRFLEKIPRLIPRIFDDPSPIKP